jgi:cyclohexanone monooxygenase
VLSNMMVSIEQHVDWITDCVRWMRDNAVEEIDVTVDAEDEWVRHVEEVGAATLYPTADSWYMGSNVPGKPRVFMAYVGGVGVYRDRCDDVAAKDYEGYVTAPREI